MAAAVQLSSLEGYDTVSAKEHTGTILSTVEGTPATSFLLSDQNSRCIITVLPSVS